MEIRKCAASVEDLTADLVQEGRELLEHAGGEHVLPILAAVPGPAAERRDHHAAAVLDAQLLRWRLQPRCGLPATHKRTQMRL